MKTGSDIFRKVQDGTIRIPSRSEAVERTKVVVIQDVNSGSNDDKYSTYPTLFEGLYRMENDGNLKDNHNLYKSNGRYPTVPTVYALADDLAKSIPVQIKQSEIPSRWSTIAAKQQELNKLFPSEYWGNCYAGRNENTWVTYNPFKDGTLAGGYLSLRYNTCKELECTYSAYTTGIIREYSDTVLLGKIQKFSTSQTTVTGEAYMQNAQKQVVEFAPDNATAEQAGVAYGTFEKNL